VRYGGTDTWPESEVYPTTAWNYGLILNERSPAKSFAIQRRSGPVPAQPFTPESAPLRLRVKAARVPAWQSDRTGLVGPLQPSPVRSAERVETVTLIPMGAARLRIASFPTIGAGPAAHEWKAPPKPRLSPFHASASHVFSSFQPIRTTSLRLEVQLDPRFSGGILEWRVAK